jgi:transcriptional regulator with XRE-family HTH domain
MTTAKKGARPLLPVPMRRASRTLIHERLAAEERYDVLDAIAMAIREHRRSLGLNQRDYADAHGLSKTWVGRLESDPGSLRLVDVVASLEAGHYRLGVYLRPTTPGGGAAGSAADDRRLELHATSDGGAPATALDAGDWPLSELLARTGANSRFPAHRVVRRVGYGGPEWFKRHYQCWVFVPDGPSWTAEWRRTG